MALRVVHTGSGASRACVAKELENQKRGEMEVSFEVTPAFEVTRDIVISRFSAPNDLDFCALVLGPDSTMRLRTWSYPVYPSQVTFLPFVVRDTFSATYLSEDTRLPFVFNTFDKPTERVLLSSVLGTYRVRMRVGGSHTQNATVDVYVERENGRSGSAFATNQNWKFNNVGKVELGCVEGSAPYDLTFDNILLNGDVPDPNWYAIHDYQGFAVADGDEGVEWVGAYDTTKPATFSENTKLSNLSRYDYARAAPGETLTGTPKGIRWHMP